MKALKETADFPKGVFRCCGRFALDTARERACSGCEGVGMGLLKNLDVGGFAVVPVSDPTKAGGFDGIHFYVFCLSSRFPRIGGGMKRRRVFTRTRKWIPAFAGMTIKSKGTHTELLKKPLSKE